jgi:ATP-dependent DNA helicase RecG
VQVNIIGKVLDVKYATKLAEMPDLSLSDIVLLDKVSKNKGISNAEAKDLKSKKLIEGRKPNFYISANVANMTGEKENYIKMRGFKDEHYRKMVLDYIDEYGSATRVDIDRLLLDILPSVLDKLQKMNKVKNLIYRLSKKETIIENQGTGRNPKWVRRSTI